MKHICFFISIGMIILLLVFIWMDTHEYFTADATAAIYNAAATSIALLGGRGYATIPSHAPSNSAVAKKATLTSNYAMLTNEAYSGRCMDNYRGELGGQVMSPCDMNSRNQRWSYASDSSIKLLVPPSTSSRLSEQCLDVERTNQRSSIQVHPCRSGVTTQHFDLDDIGRLHLRTNKDMCLDVVQLKDNYDIVYMPCSNEPSQRWSNICLPYRECVRYGTGSRTGNPCIEYKPLPAPC